MKFSSFSGGGRRMAVAAVFLALAAVAGAVERKFVVSAPSRVAPGASFTVSVRASTDVGQGEHIGFFQVESSNDDGKTWTALCYIDNQGTSVNRTVNVQAGAAGVPVKVRARVAYRAGLASDVDYTGAAIRWQESWDKWQEPPAKSVVIPVN